MPFSLAHSNGVYSFHQLDREKAVDFGLVEKKKMGR
jgi:hypothetical protein